MTVQAFSGAITDRRAVAILGIALFLSVLAITVGASSASATGQAAQSQAFCTASPTVVAPGGTVTLDASDSDAGYVEFDIDGDGVYERGDETDFIVEVTYEESGTYEPVARADGDPNAVDSCGEVTVTDPPAAEFSVDPRPGIVGESVTFDASASSDPDGTIVEYRWDFQGDGTVDETTADPTTQFTYDQQGGYSPTLTVVDDDGAMDRTSRDYTVESPSSAICQAEPTSVTPGETVTLDASDSEAGYVEFDTDGDGEYERTDETDFIVNVSYDEPGTYTPAARADGDPDAVDPCGQVVVEENEPPTAQFTVDPRPGIVGESVAFDGSASSDPDGTIAEYRWDFQGDGTVDETTAGPTTQFTYDQQGGYAPTLTVVDDDGATDTRPGDLVVEQGRTVICRAEPTDVGVGETVTLDASGSDAGYVEFDVDGDGEYERIDETDLVVSVSYDEPGTYTPAARADGDPDAVDGCGEITVNEPPIAEFSVDPRPGIVGESVTFDASASSDPDGTIVEYRWDFQSDGTVDETTADPTTQFSYTRASGYAPTLTVVDDDGATDTQSGDLIVEQDRTVICRAEPTEVEPNETVSLDASGSEQVVFVEFDTDGDGEYEEGDETDFVVETSYAETGTYTPTARAGGIEGPTAPCGEIVVSEPPDPGIPLVPIGIGGGGLLGGIGLLYYFFGGGGGGGGASVPKPKPKPGFGGSEKPRYETGVFEIPSSSGSLTVPVGFEPDLVVFSATNGARTDRATDRTAGWSRGIGWRAGGEYVNYGISVADDAQTTDQATCATADTAAIQLLRHESSGPPGRVRVALAATTADGFEVDVQVPGDDPFASGIRVQYQAIRTTAGVEIDVGTFTTPTEPGTQVVDLGVSADHVSLLGSAAVTESGRLWTTDRGVGLSVGRAVAGQGTIDQAVSGASAWPGAGHDSAAVCGHEAINLLYQDGPTVAGRTRATVTDIGEQLRLRYDRVYNGPHKLGSTARHVFPYLAMDCGESMRPAVGAVPFPGPDERLQIDCGFEPAMVSVTVSGAPLGEEIAEWATPQPFGWSEGAAIRDDDGLRQYVLHHAFTPGPRTGTPSATVGVADEAVADGGTTGESATNTEYAAGSTAPADPAAQSPESAGDSFRIRPPTEVPDDGIVGLSLLQDAEGGVLGRDECRIERMTASGFEVAVDRLETDGPAAPAGRPTLLYRAWPAGGSSSGDRTEPGERSPQGDDSEDHQ